MEEQKLRVIIEIARRRNGRVDRRGLDNDNATSLKHGNEAFLNYMLDSVFVGSKWINWLAEPVIAYAHSPPQSEKSEKSNIIWGIRKKKEKGGWKLANFPPPWIRALYCSHAMLHHHSHTYTDMLILHMFFLLRSRTNRVARHQGNVAPNPELYRPKLYPCLDVYSSYYCHSKFFEKVTIKIVKRNVWRNACAFVCLLSHKKKNQETVCGLICNYASSLSFTWKWLK